MTTIPYSPLELAAFLAVALLFFFIGGSGERRARRRAKLLAKRVEVLRTDLRDVVVACGYLDNDGDGDSSKSPRFASWVPDDLRHRLFDVSYDIEDGAECDLTDYDQRVEADRPGADHARP